jgi:hypothetical protein
MPDMDLAWMSVCRNVFLIRAPEEVVASYRERRSEVTLEDIGVVQQAELFEREADRLGKAPPVIDAADVLADPRRALAALCEAVGIAFDPAMLAWPAGPRDTDGVWAPAWYESVWASSGFGPPRPPPAASGLDPGLRAVAEAARPIYERLARYRLGAYPPEV